MGCEMVCDQLNIDKKNQMTLGGFGKTNKRIKTLEEFKNEKNNNKEFNDIDESNPFFSNNKNNISMRTGANFSSKKKLNYDTNFDSPQNNDLNSKDSIIKNLNNYPNLIFTNIKNKNFNFIGYADENNKKIEFGILKWNDGDLYKGNFENDNYKGYGQYFTESTGSNYKGEFLNNQINGYGEEEWKNGSKFEGEYVHQIKKGIGILTLNDYLNYKGQFDNNNFNGLGTLSINNGEILIQGFFKNNIIDEYAIHQNIKENLIYEGKINNKFEYNGFGILYDNNNNKIYICHWKNNNLDGDCIIITNQNNKNEIKKYLYEDGKMKKEYYNNKTTIYDKIIEIL